MCIVPDSLEWAVQHTIEQYMHWSSMIKEDCKAQDPKDDFQQYSFYILQLKEDTYRMSPYVSPFEIGNRIVGYTQAAYLVSKKKFWFSYTLLPELNTEAMKEFIKEKTVELQKVFETEDWLVHRF
jgi:hypothetical protein